MASPLKINKKSPEEIDISRLLDLFKRRWYYILVSLVLCLGAAKMYLRYSQPIFEAYATLEIVEPNAPLRSFGVLRDIDNYTDNINSEIEIIQSRRIVGDAVRRMDDVLVSYFTVGRVKTTEMYDKCPFRVMLDTTSEIPWNRTFEFRLTGERKYKIFWANSEQEFSSKEYFFGELADENGFKFRIIERKTKEAVPYEKEVTYQFRPTDYDNIESRAMAGLKVEQMGFNGSMIKISCQDNVPGFTADFVNSLSTVYISFDIQTKAQAARAALSFIEDQIDSLEKKVEFSSKSIEDFKSSRSMISVESQANEGTVRKAEVETVIDNLEIQRRAIDSLASNMNREEDGEILSSTLKDIEDPLLSSMVQGYNDLVQEKRTMSVKYTPQHPKVLEISARIEELKRSVKQNIITVRSNNNFKKAFYSQKLEEANSILKGIPPSERNYGNLAREFEVHATVLSTLSERRIDAEINVRSIVSNVNPIDVAIEPGFPISPINRKVYMLAGGVGISLGIIILVITGLAKNTISSKEEVEAISNTPVIGIVKRSSNSLQHKYPRLQIMENSKSSLSESVRAIRTNLQFLAPDKKCKVISITSTMSGEGKSFITINLAGIISLLNKKVVILDLDLRKPKLHYSFGRDNSKGLSSYLVGKHTLSEILQHTEYEFLDIITSGPIPPNPAELIESDPMINLINELKKTYDYIMVDTPPVGLVTDGVSLLKMSDVSLYVVRADYSRRQYAGIPDRLAEEQKITNMYILINSVAQTGGKYTGYGYKIYSAGYYSDEDSRPLWWQFWKRFPFKRK
jgi:tyrosine-protein kinase Etk/Wzc